MNSFAGARLVRIDVFQSGDEDRLGYAWGLLKDDYGEGDEFLMLYSRSERALSDLCKVGEHSGISEQEHDSAVNVDECWTPSVVYAKAAEMILGG